jgi:uncharacterized protein YjlB
MAAYPEPAPLDPGRIQPHRLAAADPFPNNPRLPLLLYARAFPDPSPDWIEAVFTANGWPPAWRFGVFDFHHYHSTAHEVLGCFQGRARIQFGGPEGPVLAVGAGDVAILPAGTAHKSVRVEGRFRCVGAYPAGSAVDMQKAGSMAPEAAAANISATQLPAADPVYGEEGPLMAYWGVRQTNH